MQVSTVLRETVTNRRYCAGRPGCKRSSNFEDVHRLPKTLQGVPALGGRVFVPDVTREAQFGDCLRDETVIQLLGFVDFVPSRIPACMEVPDPLKMVANVAHDIAVHDLSV